MHLKHQTTLFKAKIYVNLKTISHTLIQPYKFYFCTVQSS